MSAHCTSEAVDKMRDALVYKVVCYGAYLKL